MGRSSNGPIRRGFCIDQENKGYPTAQSNNRRRAPIGRLSLVDAITSSRLRKPLLPTDVNITAAFERNLTKASRAGPAAKAPEVRVTSMNAIIGGSRNTATSSPNSRVRAGRLRPYIVLSDDDTGSSGNSSSLLRQLSVALSRLNTKYQIAKRDFDRIVSFEELVLLSAHELLVIVKSPARNTLVLHSNVPILIENVARFSNMKLALNSQCYLVLYNDITWYMRWKFF